VRCVFASITQIAAPDNLRRAILESLEVKMEVNLRGVFPALVTPYHADGSLDEATLRALVRRLMPQVHGFLVNGTTGDFPLLTREERRRSIAVVVEEVAGQRLVIAGTGAISTGETIALTQDARAAGADVALVVAPYYLRPGSVGLTQHYQALSQALADFPFLLYNIPQLVGQPIPPQVVAELRATCPNLVGMKDTSCDLGYAFRVWEAAGYDFPILVGCDPLIGPALLAGFWGTISASANLIPQLWRAVFDAVAAGDRDTALAMQRRAQPIAELVRRGGSLAVRSGLELLGLPVGAPRLPLAWADGLDAAGLEALRAALSAIA